MKDEEKVPTKFLFSRKETAEFMSVSAIAVSQWTVDYEVKKGTRSLYDIRKVIQWRIARDQEKSSNLTMERTRLAKLQADKVEIDLRIARGEVCTIPMVMEHWQEMIMSIRAKLLAMPPKIATAAIDASSVKEIEETVMELMYEALEELKDDGVPSKTKEASSANAVLNEATTNNDGESMGRQVQETKPRSKRRARAVADK